jgi:hypothetical protein
MSLHYWVLFKKTSNKQKSYYGSGNTVSEALTNITPLTIFMVYAVYQFGVFPLGWAIWETFY